MHLVTAVAEKVRDIQHIYYFTHLRERGSQKSKTNPVAPKPPIEKHEPHIKHYQEEDESNIISLGAAAAVLSELRIQSKPKVANARKSKSLPS